MKSLLYASLSTLAAETEEAELARIESTSRERNARLGVTGTLIFTRDRFAQILEGPAEAVDALMMMIEQDDRHAKVTIVDAVERERRDFDNWSFSYSGASRYVDKHIRPLIDGVDSQKVLELRNLMKALAEAA